MPFNPTPAGIADACRLGDRDLVRGLLDADPSLASAEVPYGRYRAFGGQLYRRSRVSLPIEVAAYHAQVGAIDELLAGRDGDVGPEELLRRFATSIGVAGHMGHGAIVELLVGRALETVGRSAECIASSVGWQWLHMAATHQCVPLVQGLLDLGVPPHRDVDGWQPIHIATWYGWPLGGHPFDDDTAQTIELLLGHGAPPSAWVLAGLGDAARLSRFVDDHPDSATAFERGHQRAIRTPLGIAAWHGHMDVVQALLARGADPDGGRPEDVARDEFGSPLVFAVAGGHFEIAHLLIDAGGDIRGEVVASANVVEQCYQFGPPDLATRVLRMGGRPTTFSHVRAGNHGAVAELLHRCPEEPQSSWSGAPHVFGEIVAGACWVGEPTILRMALGLRPELLPPSRVPSLIRRAIISHNRDGSFADYLGIVEQLLQHLDGSTRREQLGAIVEFTVREYLQPVFGAPVTSEQAIELCDLLLAHGADIDARDENSSRTALVTAIALGHLDVAIALLERGARVDGSGAEANDPVALCRRLGFVELGERLKEAVRGQ